MTDKAKTKTELIAELQALRLRVAELEQSETKRQRAEEELQQSENRYSTLVEKGSDGIVVLQDGLVKFANPKAAEMTGLSQSDLIGKLWIGFVAPQYRELTMERFKRRAAGEDAPSKYEIEILNKDGSGTLVEVNAALVEYDGKPAVLSSVRDITQRQRAEEALRNSEEKYRTLVDNAPVGVYKTNLKGDILYVNDTAVKMLGFDSAEEVIAGGGLIRYRNQNDRQILLEELTKKGKANSLEFELLTKTGETRHVILNAILEGETLSGMVIDITERKQAEMALSQSEAFMETVFDGIADFFSVQDTNYNIIKTAKVMERAFGKDIVGKKCYQIYEGRNEICPDCPVVKVLKTGKPALSDERVDLSGRIAVEIWAFPIKDTQGNITAVVEHGRDITKRKQAETLLRAVFDNSPIGIYIAQDGKVQLGNPEIIKFTGYSLADTLGKESLSFVFAEDREMVRQNAVKLLRGERSSPYEYRLVGKNGTLRSVMETVTSIQYRGKRAVLGSSMDITEHKQAESALQESEELYRSLFTNMLNGFAYCKMLFEKDKPSDFVYLSVNIAFETLTGLKNVVGKKVSEVIPGIQKSDPELFEIYGRVALSGIPERFETYVQALEMWFAISVYCPAKEYFVAIFDVITERKLAEKALKAQKELTDRILTSTPNAILVLDRNLKIMLANPKFYQTFKIGGVEGKLFNDVIHIQRLEEAISKTLNEKSPQLNLEFRYGVENRERILLTQITPMAEEGVLLILRDVTAERTRAEQLNHIDRLASIGEVAAGVAHELNNPLANVIGYSELVLNGSIPQEVKSDIELIHSNAQRAVTIVRNLLTFARYHELQQQLLNINDLIKHVLEMRDYELKVSNIEVITEFADKLPDILGDRQQLEQVFLNIVLNAEQAMLEAHNQGRFTVRTETVRSRVRVALSDDGPGIPAQNLWRVFTPFFTTKPPGKGTGLGLSICYGIVTEHGGRIYAESKMGQGATFFVELPVAEADGVHHENS